MSVIGNLFGRSRKAMPPADLSVLKCDVHSHFIPGIDDGAQTVEQSVELVRAMQDFGFSKVITTPHVMADGFRNTPEIILEGLERVRQALREQSIPVTIDAAAEYYLDHELERLVQARNVLTFGGERNLLLFELPFISEPAILLPVVFNMQTQGYRPVLAHPERYPFWYQDTTRPQQLKDRGVLFQLNTVALSGAYGPAARKAAERMIDMGWYELVGSDCHGMDHVHALEASRTAPALHKLLASGKLINHTL